MTDQDVLNSMRRDWDERARKNARHFVASSRETWSDEEFFRSGTAEVQDIVEKELDSIARGRSPESLRALEIGCGAGRMTMSLSRIFGQVSAIDVSAEMIAQARLALADRRNVDLQVNNGCDLSMFSDESFDFALSAIVFQHIPKQFIVENYIRETWRVLRPNSIFKFQLQGYPIPEKDADTWVGAGFTEGQMNTIADRLGFRIIATSGAGTQYYWLTFLKPSS